MAEAALTVLTSGELSPSTPDVSLLGEALGRTTLESTSEAKASESQETDEEKRKHTELDGSATKGTVEAAGTEGANPIEKIDRVEVTEGDSIEGKCVKATANFAAVLDKDDSSKGWKDRIELPREWLVKGLGPTPIQEYAIPAMLSGMHVVGQGKGGSGKTGAFLLSALSRVDPSLKKPQFLIFVSTQPLGQDVQTQAHKLLKAGSGISVELVAGDLKGSASHAQAQVIVGTVKAISNNQKGGRNAGVKIPLEGVKGVIVDEADLILSYDDQQKDLSLLIRKLDVDPQIALFSATFHGLAHHHPMEEAKKDYPPGPLYGCTQNHTCTRKTGDGGTRTLPTCPGIFKVTSAIASQRSWMKSTLLLSEDSHILKPVLLCRPSGQPSPKKVYCIKMGPPETTGVAHLSLSVDGPLPPDSNSYFERRIRLLVEMINGLRRDTEDDGPPPKVLILCNSNKLCSRIYYCLNRDIRSEEGGDFVTWFSKVLVSFTSPSEASNPVTGQLRKGDASREEQMAFMAARVTNLQNMRTGNRPVMVGTYGQCARGLDIPGLDMVVLWESPSTGFGPTSQPDEGSFEHAICRVGRVGQDEGSNSKSWKKSCAVIHMLGSSETPQRDCTLPDISVQKDWLSRLCLMCDVTEPRSLDPNYSTLSAQVLQVLKNVHTVGGKGGYGVQGEGQAEQGSSVYVPPVMLPVSTSYANNNSQYSGGGKGQGNFQPSFHSHRQDSRGSPLANGAHFSKIAGSPSHSLHHHHPGQQPSHMHASAPSFAPSPNGHPSNGHQQQQQTPLSHNDWSHSQQTHHPYAHTSHPAQPPQYFSPPYPQHAQGQQSVYPTGSPYGGPPWGGSGQHAPPHYPSSGPGGPSGSYRSS